MKQKDILISTLRIIHAIEVLEYEDKNHLAGNNKSRSETKQSLLNYALEKAHTLKELDKQ